MDATKEFVIMSSYFGQAPRITSILLITSGLVEIAIPAQ